ncbi:hypothetical protein F4806DRAFT_496051 [Annulohypoxylon nitens]|nr:hypothetical protein F4806DRAFT_496051 [Annulohypoxylon nitens]
MKFTIAAVALATGASASYPVASSYAAASSSSAAASSSYAASSSAAVSSVPSYPVAASSAAPNATAYTTEVVTSYETYCPGPTQITYGTNTYTVTEATTLTITDCPCTISKPIYTTSSVACATCAPASPVYPTSAPAPPVYPNSTAAITTPGSAYPTGSVPGTTTGSTPSSIPTAGAGKVAALSGAGLAGLLGLAVAAL